jgi:hypothetical protein
MTTFTATLNGAIPTLHDYDTDGCPDTLPATMHTPLDLSIDCTGDDTGATWWECPECGDYAWLAPGQEQPECSCEGLL